MMNVSNVDYPDRFLVAIDKWSQQFQYIVNDITRLVRYPLGNLFKPSRKENAAIAVENEEIWRLFQDEKIYDTAHVTLDHFHLFEWFPMAPGRFHTPEGENYRYKAKNFLRQKSKDNFFYDPYGKSMMFRGGIGAVRLRPQMVGTMPYYFMSASSNGVCHEGFPVLIPRDYYAKVKPIMDQLGAAPVRISGEMRYLYQPPPAFFDGPSDLPSLYLYVDKLVVLPKPRDQVSKFEVSAGISFWGEFKGKEGIYATYATFNPANPDSLERAVNWMEQYYVTQQYKGIVITDFDEVRPRFPGAVFGLPELMTGNLNQERAVRFLAEHGFGGAGKNFYMFYNDNRQIYNQGAYIEGNVDTGGGDFIGRDQSVTGPTTNN